MTKARKLSASEISERIGGLKGWSIDSNKLHKEIKFDSFANAIAFMAGGAIHAERLNHHPEWSNIYDRVIVDLITHDCEGISELDFELAAALDSVPTPS